MMNATTWMGVAEHAITAIVVIVALVVIYRRHQR